MNSRKQGDIGTAFAIAYFVAAGYTISVPLSDSQGYDLVIEKDGKLERVQVKTAFKNTRVELRTISNTRGQQLDVRYFNKLNSEKLFVVDKELNYYLFESNQFDGKAYLDLRFFEAFRVKAVVNLER